MLLKVDWLSFSVMLGDYVCVDERDTETAFIAAVDALNPYLGVWLGFGDGWTRAKGRAPYAVAWQHPSKGVTVMYHAKLPHALVEISGKGCDMIEANGFMWDVLNATKTRATRIDIAADILTDVRPTEFALQRDLGRFKSHSVVVSESGETYYVGARSSNRYARVYRYNPPHERSAFLRIEYVVKAEDAKIMCNALLTQDIRALANGLGEKFGWSHPVYLPESVDAAEIEAYRPERREGKTLFWLGDTVAPLLLRLHQEGTFDVRRWFYDNILTRLDCDNPLTEPECNQ